MGFSITTQDIFSPVVYPKRFDLDPDPNFHFLRIQNRPRFVWPVFVPNKYSYIFLYILHHRTGQPAVTCKMHLTGSKKGFLSYEFLERVWLRGINLSFMPRVVNGQLRESKSKCPGQNGVSFQFKYLDKTKPTFKWLETA